MLSDTWLKSAVGVLGITVAMSSIALTPLNANLLLSTIKLQAEKQQLQFSGRAIPPTSVIKGRACMFT